MEAIYEIGETQLQTTVENGICAYTNGKTPEVYLKELGPGFVCIPLEAAIEQMERVIDNKHVSNWEEIEEDQYDYWLEVLPPEKWETVDGVNIFRLSEYTISNVTQHCARYNNKFFGATRRTSESYEDMAKQVKAL